MYALKSTRKMERAVSVFWDEMIVKTSRCGLEEIGFAGVS
jgi:hypothetical protein